MSLFSKTDQAVTANSTTTKQSTTGAPIGTSALVNKGGGANAHYGNTSSGSRASVDVNMFGNVTPGVFISGMAVGVFGADTTETTVSGKLTHAGWQLRKAGTGSITNVTYTGSATGYNNTDVITIASSQAGGNATVTVSTNASGGALVLTISVPGGGFTAVNATPNVAIANSTGGATAGSGATFTAVAGGRAGRIHYETLVAMGSITGDASDDAV